MEDQPPVRRALEMKFRLAGYRVLTANDGEVALRLIYAHRPDAVVSDLTMPKLDGRKLCEITDALKPSRPFLTVVTSGRITADEHEWVGRMQDVVLVAKPYSLAGLLETVDTYLGLSAPPCAAAAAPAPGATL